MAFRSPSFEAVQEAHIGNVVLGRAPVKIISSICAATVEEMIEQAKAIDASGADIIEWRADYYADDASWQKAATAMKAVVSKPILYTFRSQSEGGVRTEPMSNTTWRKKVLAAIDSKLFDAVDIEFDRGRAEFLVEAARKTGIASIVSWHSFVPGEYDEELGYFGKLEQMSYTGADVLKIVAMPDKGIVSTSPALSKKFRSFAPNSTLRSRLLPCAWARPVPSRVWVPPPSAPAPPLQAL